MNHMISRSPQSRRRYLVLLLLLALGLEAGVPEVAAAASRRQSCTLKFVKKTKVFKTIAPRERKISKSMKQRCFKKMLMQISKEKS